MPGSARTGRRACDHRPVRVLSPGRKRYRNRAVTIAMLDAAEIRALADGIAAAAERATEYADAASAASTRRAYAADWRDFCSYCERLGLDPLPAAPQVVALYVADLAAARRVGTIRRRLVVIARAHARAGHPNPTADPHVRAVVQGVVRTHGSAPRRKDALTVERLKAALWQLGDDLKGARDRALLLLTFAGGFRRSEIAALDFGDLRFEERGLVVTLRKFKTDQVGAGREVPIPYLRTPALCPARAVQAWIAAAAIVVGPLFRTFTLPHGRRAASARLTEQRIDGRDVARLVQRVAKRAGIEGDFGAHSLRAGFVTSGAARGVPEASLQAVTGHRSTAILRNYVRRATLFDDPALPRIMGEA
jgi:integrase